MGSHTGHLHLASLWKRWVGKFLIQSLTVCIKLGTAIKSAHDILVAISLLYKYIVVQTNQVSHC